MSCVCYVLVRVCFYVFDGHLLRKGCPLGSRLWCLTASLSLSHWYPGSGVVLDCIDSWSLHHYLLVYKLVVFIDDEALSVIWGHWGKWHLFQGNKVHILGEQGKKTILENMEHKLFFFFEFGKQGNKQIYFKGTKDIGTSTPVRASLMECAVPSMGTVKII